MATDTAKKFVLVPAEEVATLDENKLKAKQQRRGKTNWSTLDIAKEAEAPKDGPTEKTWTRGYSHRGGRRNVNGGGGGRGRGRGGNWRNGNRRGRQYDALGGYVQDGVYVHPDLTVTAKYAVQQMEFYFSPDNLCRDTYIRARMDMEGYVPVALVANFPAVCYIHSDLETLLDALEKSEVLELDRKNEKIRLRDNWKKWLFPNSEGGFGLPLYIKLSPEEAADEPTDEADEETPSKGDKATTEEENSASTLNLGDLKAALDNEKENAPVAATA